MENEYSQNREMGDIVTLKENGYGFIKGPDHNLIFFHASKLLSATFSKLKRGTKVEYEVVNGSNGPVATNIIVVHDIEVERKIRKQRGDK